MIIIIIIIIITNYDVIILRLLQYYLRSRPSTFSLELERYVLIMAALVSLSIFSVLCSALCKHILCCAALCGLYVYWHVLTMFL